MLWGRKARHWSGGSRAGPPSLRERGRSRYAERGVLRDDGAGIVKEAANTEKNALKEKVRVAFRPTGRGNLGLLPSGMRDRETGNQDSMEGEVGNDSAVSREGKKRGMGASPEQEQVDVRGPDCERGKEIRQLIFDESCIKGGGKKRDGGMFFAAGGN